MGIPAWQQAIRDKCNHASGTFIEFRQEDIERSIPERFEQMVRMYPERLAVKTSSHQLTYEGLNSAANRVAHAIIDRAGREPEPIALLVEHDVRAIIALVGILKSGKFYVPLDPLFPNARTAYMLDDCQARLLMTTTDRMSHAADLAQSRLEVLNIDGLDPKFSTENPHLPIAPDSLAYLLYTSGSSGQPKGVTENHRNLLHEIMRLTNDFHICRQDRITLLNSLSFSGSARSVYGSLLNGASLFPYDIRERGPARLASWLIEEAITIYRSSPTVFRQLAETLTGQERFPALRLITTAGEPALQRDVELYQKHFSENCIFVNGLRITETGSVRHYFIDKETEVSGPTVPVGYPMQDMQILVLDDGGREVPCHEVGEIAVRSRYLSSGYWRRPALTQATFLPDPSGGDERTYLTGDLGVMQSDGCLTHLGRKDSQMKVRGQRIEPAEIEEALLTLDAVKEVVVTVRDVGPDQQCLMAYIVPAPQSAPTPSALRRALAERLPDAMIPSKYVVLEALPLTPTGKVDRRALPAPDTARPALDSPLVKPRTPIEAKLIAIWADVLGLDEVGIHDSFLELGGHSLLATKLIARVIDVFAVELPLRALFEAPTVAEIAVVIIQHQANMADQGHIERMLVELEALSDQQAQHLLADEPGLSHRQER